MVDSHAAGIVPAPRIVFITSISSRFVSIARGEYCVSKAGLSMVAQLFAARLAASGIGVYEIRPGLIDTEMTRPVRAQYDERIAGGLIPMGRWGSISLFHGDRIRIGRRFERANPLIELLRCASFAPHRSGTAAGCGPTASTTRAGEGLSQPAPDVVQSRRPIARSRLPDSPLARPPIGRPDSVTLRPDPEFRAQSDGMCAMAHSLRPTATLCRLNQAGRNAPT
jgi:NAD(P)-dependent dehydrogenase (short-subunit alcohol dehydrogenase family)